MRDVDRLQRADLVLAVDQRDQAHRCFGVRDDRGSLGIDEPGHHAALRRARENGGMFDRSTQNRKKRVAAAENGDVVRFSSARDEEHRVGVDLEKLCDLIARFFDDAARAAAVTVLSRDA